MQISDLKPSISQMSDEEAFALIKETRFQRRQMPVKKASKAKSKKPLSVKATVKALSPEQKLKLLEELGGL